MYLGVEGFEKMYSIEELSELIGIPVKTIYKWTSDRFSGIPTYKLGKHLRFRLSEIDQWLRKYRASQGVKEFSKGSVGKTEKRI